MMNDQDRATLQKNYVMLSMYYQRQLDDAVIKLYVEDLSDLPIADVQSAMTRYRKDPKNKSLPLPAQIREIVIPIIAARKQVEATRKILLDAPRESNNDPKIFEKNRSLLASFYKRFGNGGKAG